MSPPKMKVKLRLKLRPSNMEERERKSIKSQEVININSDRGTIPIISSSNRSSVYIGNGKVEVTTKKKATTEIPRAFQK